MSIRSANPASAQGPPADSNSSAASRDVRSTAVDSGIGFLEPPTRADAIGRIGQFEVFEVLGSGGFGIVLRAFDEVLRRVVALKVLGPRLALDADAHRRFLREARAAGTVLHDSVISVYRVEEQPIPFLVMEYVQGQTLQQKLAQSGPLELHEVLSFGQQIASGLAAAHEHGLIHRDIKPANIMLEAPSSASATRLMAEKAKITDFGLARAADEVCLTQTGVIAGTPLYMAPEQAQAEDIDARADLFSLGSVLYEMCTGHAAFEAPSSVAVLQRVCEEPPLPIRSINPSIPEWLCDVIARLQAKNRADRYDSAKEVADLLGKCLSELQQYGKVHSMRSARQRKFRRRALVGCGVASVALIGLVAAWQWFSNGDAPRRIAPVTTPVAANAIQPAALPTSYTNKLGMDFVLVPKGKFWMGGGGGKVGDKEVEIPRDFFLGKFEVTRNQWDDIMGTNLARVNSPPPTTAAGNASVNGKPEQYPVNGVSWLEAQKFLLALNARTKEEGWYYRLPTQAEWEYACRGGPSPNRDVYAFDYYLDQPSNELLPTQANVACEQLAPVGSYQPNALGIYDMHGSVYEWCDENDVGAGLLRGGCWFKPADSARAATPFRFGTGEHPPDFGIRIARVPVNKP